MSWTGDTLGALNEFMNRRYMDDIVPSVVERNPLFFRMMDNIEREDFWGEYAVIRLKTAVPVTAVARPEVVDVPLPGQHAYKQLLLNVKQYVAVAGATKEQFEDAGGKPGSAANLAEEKISDCKIDLRTKLNHAFYGDGTGRLARVSAWNNSTLTVTVDNTRADFGWDKCQFMRDGMKVDIYTVADITGSSAWTLKCSNVTISSLSRSAGTFVVSGHDVDPADGDIVFAHGAVTLTSDTKFSCFNEMNGLMSIVDDGSTTGWGAGGDANNGSWAGTTFQGLNRTLYNPLKSTILKANDWGSGSEGTPASWDLDVINAAIRNVEEYGDGGGQITAIYCTPKMRDAIARKARLENNPFTTANSGKIIPGMYIEEFRSSTGRLIPVIPISTLPENTLYLVNEKDLILFEKVPIDWEKQEGKIWFPAPGSRNLTFEAWLRTRLQIGARRCDNCVRIEDLIDTE